MKRAIILFVILFCHKGLWAQVEVQGEAFDTAYQKSNTDRSFSQSSGEIDVYLPIPISSDEDLITIIFNTLQTNLEYSSRFNSNSNRSYPGNLNSITYGIGTLLDFDEKYLLIEGDVTKASDEWHPTGPVGTGLRIVGILEWFEGLNLGLGASHSTRRNKGQTVPLVYINYESDWIEITGLLPFELEIIGNLGDTWQVQLTGNYESGAYQIAQNQTEEDLLITLYYAALSIGFKLTPQFVILAGIGQAGDQKWEFTDVDNKKTVERIKFKDSSSAFLKVAYNF